MASALMQWFSFTCPSCALTLQAKLPEGITSVQCSTCKSVFAVQIQPTFAGPSGPAGQQKKGARKRSKIDKEGNTAPRVLSAYNVFMKEELAKVKREHPELVHKDAFKMAADRWQVSPMNPQNGGDQVPKRGAGDDVAAMDEGADCPAADHVAPAADSDQMDRASRSQPRLLDSAGAGTSPSTEAQSVAARRAEAEIATGNEAQSTAPAQMASESSTHETS